MYYSFESAGVHFLMLSSYSPIHPGSPQLAWLVSDLASVDRQRTPWLVAALHAPWYNSNSHHQNEGEPAAFQREVEPLLYAAGTDVVFAGHVHAYERSEPAFNGRPDPCGVTYITIGDGGNREARAYASACACVTVAARRWNGISGTVCRESAPRCHHAQLRASPIRKASLC